MSLKPTLPSLKDVLQFFSLDRLSERHAHRPAQTLFPEGLDIISFQKVFQGYLESYLAQKINDFEQYTDSEVSREAIRHAVLLLKQGGKRIRPYLAFMSYVTEHGTNEPYAMQASMALELFHSFALIHDDIIDSGMKRHGIPTTHQHIQKIIGNSYRGNEQHIAEGFALLAGDVIFSWSHELLAASQSDEAQRIFYRMIEEVVAGQMLDVSFSYQKNVSTAQILRKNELKTALYSFVNPMLIGSALAHSSNHDSFYREFGMILGQAFQIQDDMLDIVGNPKATGKQRFADVAQGQHTILSQYIIEHADRNQKEMFLSLFGKTIDPHGERVLQQLFEATGAITFAQQTVSQLFEQAESLIANVYMEDTDRTRWQDLMKMLDKRTA